MNRTHLIVIVIVSLFLASSFFALSSEARINTSRWNPYPTSHPTSTPTPTATPKPTSTPTSTPTPSSVADQINQALKSNTNITLPSGTYTLTKTLYLSGLTNTQLQSSGTTILVVPSDVEIVGLYAFQCSGLKIFNVTLQGSKNTQYNTADINNQHGIYLNQCTNSQVENVTVEDFAHTGIVTYMSQSITLRNNKLLNNGLPNTIQVGSGIDSDEDSAMTVTGNYISGSWDNNLWISRTSNSLITNNTLLKAGHANLRVGAVSTLADNAHNNTFNNNVLSEGNLEGNDGQAGLANLYVTYATGNVFNGNTITGGKLVGLAFDSANQNTVIGGNISFNAEGVDFRGSSSANTLSNATITHNTHNGVNLLDSAASNQILYNRIVDSGDYEIVVQSSGSVTNTTIIGNTVSYPNVTHTGTIINNSASSTIKNNVGYP